MQGIKHIQGFTTGYQELLARALVEIQLLPNGKVTHVSHSVTDREYSTVIVFQYKCPPLQEPTISDYDSQPRFTS